MGDWDEVFPVNPGGGKVDIASHLKFRNVNFFSTSINGAITLNQTTGTKLSFRPSQHSFHLTVSSSSSSFSPHHLSQQQDFQDILLFDPADLSVDSLSIKN